jgi:hypothetical protein
VIQQISSRRDVEEYLVSRATKDETFLAELRADPKAVVERELANLLPGFVQLPSSMEIEIVEETPTKLYLVLPPRPMPEDGELSDSQLEAVAGGVVVTHNYNGAPEFPTQNFGPNTIMGVKGQQFHDAGWLYTAPNP